MATSVNEFFVSDTPYSLVTQRPTPPTPTQSQTTKVDFTQIHELLKHPCAFRSYQPFRGSYLTKETEQTFLPI